MKLFLLLFLHIRAVLPIIGGIVLFLSFPSGLSQQELEHLAERHQLLINSLKERAFNQAIQHLKSIEKRDLLLFRENSYPYLLARLYQDQKEYEEAIEYYNITLQTNPLLADYAELHLAEIYRSLDDLTREREHLGLLINDHPTSLLVPRAWYRMGRSYLEDKDYQQALAAFLKLEGLNKSPYQREAGYLVAHCYDKLNKPLQAAQKYEELIESNQSDDYALYSLQKLESLEKSHGFSLARTPLELWQRGNVYFNNREFQRSHGYFLEVIKREPLSKRSADSHYNLGLSYYRQRNYPQALRWFQLSTKRFAGSSWEADALYQIGMCYSRQEKDEKALECFLQLIHRFPHHQLAPNALLRIIEHHYHQEEAKEALTHVDEFLRRYETHPLCPNALMQAVLICRENRWFELALYYLDRILIGKHPESIMTEALFWRGRLSEAMDLLPEAEQSYEKLLYLYPNNFYSFRAAKRLKTFLSPEGSDYILRLSAVGGESFRQGDLQKARELFQILYFLSDGKEKRREILSLLDRCYSQVEEYKKIKELKIYESRSLRANPRGKSNPSPLAKAEELLFLHLYHEGVEELAANTPDDKGGAVSWLLSQSHYQREAGAFHQSIRSAERLIQSIPPDLPFPLLPRALQELLYPLGYFPLVEASTAPRGVDKYLVAAVIREESRFHSQAKSTASARGLMQLIPSTARQMGSRLGLRRFSVEDLYRPQLNIELGVEHLRELLEEFQGNLFAAIASYNAGREVVRRWLQNCSTEEPEELILEIKFEETKKFVQRVMRSYWRYKEIYGDAMN